MLLKFTERLGHANRRGNHWAAQNSAGRYNENGALVKGLGSVLQT